VAAAALDGTCRAASRSYLVGRDLDEVRVGIEDVDRRGRLVVGLAELDSLRFQFSLRLVVPDSWLHGNRRGRES